MSELMLSWPEIASSVAWLLGFSPPFLMKGRVGSLMIETAGYLKDRGIKLSTINEGNEYC
jgi:hypothetical protein